MKTLKIEIQEKQHGSETEYRIVSEKGDIIYQTFNYTYFIKAKTAIESYIEACAKNAGTPAKKEQNKRPSCNDFKIHIRNTEKELKGGQAQ